MKNSTTKSLIAGILGGAVAGGALLLAGVGGGSTKTTTIVQQAPLTSASSTASVSGGLTPQQIYKRDAPGVVFIRSTITQQVQSPFNLFPQQEQGQASGSGVVIDKSGDILTNNHVIDGASNITVQLGDNQVVGAKVVGTDPSDDLAVLKISPSGLSLTPLQLGNSDTAQVGDPTVAIGNPFGLDRTLTTGVVSALQRKITAPNGFEIDNVIQTDAPINPGNSGGPLIDANGNVIGINSQIETGGGSGSVGIGFAVPINTAKKVIPQLETTGTVKQAYLGLTTVTIDQTMRQLNLPATSGALIQCVQSGTPAAKAGLQGGVGGCSQSGQVAVGGDIIVSIDGQAVNTNDDLAGLIGKHQPGDQVTVGILHPNGSGGYTKKSVTVTLGTRPAQVSNGTGATGGSGSQQGQGGGSGGFGGLIP
jgi:S1-C subfamily serine protease